VFDKINTSNDGHLTTVQFANGIELLAPEAKGNLYEVLKTFAAIDTAGDGVIQRTDFLANANRLKEWANEGAGGSSFEAASSMEVAEFAAEVALVEASASRRPESAFRRQESIERVVEEEVEEQEKQVDEAQARWQEEQQARMEAEGKARQEAEKQTKEKQTKEAAEEQQRREVEEQAKQEEEEKAKQEQEEEKAKQAEEVASSRSRAVSQSLAFAKKGAALRKGKGKKGRNTSIAREEAVLAATKEGDGEHDEQQAAEEDKIEAHVKEEKSAFGAAMLGAAAGGWIAGPVGAAVGAVGASYASTWQDEGGVGDFMRHTGGFAVKALAGGQRMVRAAAVGARHNGQLAKWERTRRVTKTRTFFVTKQCEIVWLICRGEMAITGCAFGVDVKGIESLCGAAVNAAVESPDTASKGKKWLSMKSNAPALFWFEVIIRKDTASVGPSRSESARRDSSVDSMGSVRLLLAATTDVQRAKWVQDIRTAVNDAQNTAGEDWEGGAERTRQLTLEKQLTVGMGLETMDSSRRLAAYGATNPLLPSHDQRVSTATLGDDDEDVWAWHYDASLGSSGMGLVGEGSLGAEALDASKDRGVASAVQIIRGALQDQPGEDVAATVACFLRIYSSQIGGEAVGDYLGEGDDDEKAQVRMAYVRAISFEGKPFVDALRYYLTGCGFVLPGEAQKIERLVDAFAKRYWVDNLNAMEGISCSDTAMVLGYSIILLNTDLHNPNVKKSMRMTKPQFVKNNQDIDSRCLGDERNGMGRDIPQEVLEQIYESIRADEISLHGARGDTTAGGGIDLSAARDKLNSALVVLTERVADGKCKLTEQLMEAGKHVLHEAAEAGTRTLSSAAERLPTVEQATEAGKQLVQRVKKTESVSAGVAMSTAEASKPGIDKAAEVDDHVLHKASGQHEQERLRQEAHERGIEDAKALARSELLEAAKEAQEKQAEEQAKKEAAEQAKKQAEEQARRRVIFAEHPCMQTHPLALAHPVGGEGVLWIIHTSRDKNAVVFKADEEAGVEAFWVMFEKASAPTEGLNYAEQKGVCGFKCKPQLNGQSGGWRVELNALKGRRITVSAPDERTNVGWIARTKIDGVDGVRLLAIHLHMEEDAAVPTVAFVEIFGAGLAYERNGA
jgi:membrane protein involved in colicin uptake